MRRPLSPAERKKERKRERPHLSQACPSSFSRCPRTFHATFAHRGITSHRRDCLLYTCIAFEYSSGTNAFVSARGTLGTRNSRGRTSARWRATTLHHSPRERERERDRDRDRDRERERETGPNGCPTLVSHSPKPNQKAWWGLKPRDFDRSPCPGNRERERERGGKMSMF